MGTLGNLENEIEFKQSTYAGRLLPLDSHLRRAV
jgi:hypothetical protein